MTNHARTMGFVSYMQTLGGDIGRILKPGGACNMAIVGDPNDTDVLTIGFSREDRLAPLNLMQRQDFTKKFKRGILSGMENANILMSLHLDDFVKDSIRLKEVFAALDHCQVVIQVCCLDVYQDDPLMLGFAFTRTGEVSAPAETPEDCAEFVRQSEQVRRIRA